ncbi:MAG: hypothetical protein ISR21_07810 [Candidatus Poseidoniaceae archaeon]|nr:hypothetical protein [Candidatus Poseidoniaceae archaeon]
MRPLNRTFSALLLTFLMLASIMVMESPDLVEHPLETESQGPQFTSGRGASNSYLSAGGSTSQSIDARHIAALGGAGWIIGSEYNASLTFGTTTLQPTSPYAAYGEFFLAMVDDTGVWRSVIGADHSYGAGGLSFLTDIAVDISGDIAISGYYYGEISFPRSSGPDIILSNTNSGYHFEGFVATLTPNGDWQWVRGLETLVNGTGEYSSTSGVAFSASGDVLLTGEFEGETDFGGIPLNVTNTEIYVASYDFGSGGLNWVLNGGGIGVNRVFDLAPTTNGGVKLATISDGFSQWGTTSYLAKGTVDAVIVEVDPSGALLGLTGYGTPNEQTIILNIDIDFNGDTYYAGTFGGSLTGTGWSATASYGGNDIFIVREATSSSNSWAFVSGSSQADEPQGLAITTTGKVVYGGYMIASHTASSYTLTPSNHDGFVVGLSDSGSAEWAESVGGSQYDYVWDLAVNDTDSIGVGGAYSGSMTHDGTSITSTGGRDAFIWSFDPAALKDTDSDSIVDVDDNCPTVSNPTQANTDMDDKGDACDSDDDNDGLTDNFPDLCPRGGEFNWTSMQDTSNPSASSDWDNDGCKDDVEDLDDDNDQVLDVNDICPYTSYDPPRPTWVSDPSNDLDGDGCRDSDEDVDDDADGFDDVEDDCPTTPGTSSLGTTGCLDSDSDGWSDTYDDCPTEAGNSTLGGKNACPDTDGDGWSNTDDAFPNEPTQWADGDADNYGDNLQGLSPDDCSTVRGTSTLDRLGCFDSDEDGYSDADSSWYIEDGADAFPNDATQWADSDEDGFGDNWGNSTWDDRKSSWNGIYVDGATEQDACPNQFGTSWQQGILGCLDTDSDGWADFMDAFDNDPTQWEDTDMDSFGDNESGNQPDACPALPGNSTVDRFGCMDADGDGYSNADITWGYELGGDAFPDEASQWSDADGDGFGDNPLGITPDACPTVRDSSSIDRIGCADTDGDGYSDPDGSWTLADGADACVSGAGNSTADRTGCFDADGDGYSNPSGDWKVKDGADAYPDDPLRWIKDASSTDGASSSSTLVLGIGAVVALAVIAGLAFFFIRKPDGEVVDKNWNDGNFAPMGGAMPAMPNMAAQPTVLMPNYSNTAAPVAGGMPNMAAQPAAAVAMPNMAAQPVQAAQPAAQPAPVQPDPAREYYNGLIAQGYPQESALQYTQQYYPAFQG